MNPLERLTYFFDAVNRKDADAVMSCYETEAVLSLAPNGDMSTGQDQIRAALAAFLTFEMTLSEQRELLSSDGNIALTGLTWSATGTGPDGEPIALGGRSTEVLRRQADGDWLIAVDSPWWAS